MSPLVVPFLVFYALLTLAMPILVVALYVRCTRLRARLMAAEEEAAPVWIHPPSPRRAAP
jgi:hypothetical protein